MMSPLSMALKAPLPSNVGLLFVLFYCSLSYGGTWDSGGGRLADQRANPWFVANTSVVRFCIVGDFTNFGVSEDSTREAFLKAASWWRGEFRRGVLEKGPNPLLHVGTQTFQSEACTDSTDLKIQLGTMTKLQKEKLGDPHAIIAATVRTEYDPVHLRSKGFMYISPESGPLKLKGPVASTRWQLYDNRLLTLTFIHELSHFYGMSHRGGANSVLGAEFLKFIVGAYEMEGVDPDELAAVYARTTETPSPLTHRTGEPITGCQEDNLFVLGKLAPLSPSDRCVRLVFKDKPYSEIIIQAASSETGPYRTVREVRSNYLAGANHTFISVTLTTDQQVINEKIDHMKVFTALRRFNPVRLTGFDVPFVMNIDLDSGIEFDFAPTPGEWAINRGSLDSFWQYH